MKTMKCSGGCGKDCPVIPPGLDIEDEGLEGFIANEMPMPASIQCEECYKRECDDEPTPQ